MKKLFCVVLCGVLLLSSVLLVQASIIPNYALTADYSPTTQGANGWFYQYRDGGSYSNYVNLTKATEGTNWCLYTASGSIQNFVTATGKLQAKGSSVDNKTAFVWKAPYSGKVKLTANNNIRMAYGAGQKAPIEAGIAHTNSKYELIDYQNEYDNDITKSNDNYIWWASIAENDNIGVEPYDINIDVSAGDMLFFEIGSVSSTAATVIWDPVIKYLQAADYSVGGESVYEIENVAEGVDVAIELYNRDASFKAELYSMVYDSSNRLRAVKYIADKNGSVVITMPSYDKSSDETSYKGWSIRVFAVTNSTGRFYPVDISDKLVLN